jgi:hypothetical protein
LNDQLEREGDEMKEEEGGERGKMKRGEFDTILIGIFC